MAWCSCWPALGIVTILHTFRNLVLISLRPGRCEPVFAGGTAQFSLVLDNRRPDARTSLRLSIANLEPVEVDIEARGSKVAILGHPATRRGWLPLPPGHHRNHLAARPGPCLELCRPGPRLPGLSGAGRQGAAAAVERRLGARHDPRRSRRR
jgi:hypothetical protein